MLLSDHIFIFWVNFLISYIFALVWVSTTSGDTTYMADGTPVVLHAVVVQSLSHVRLFVTPWTAACQAVGVSFPKCFFHWKSTCHLYQGYWNWVWKGGADSACLGEKILFSKASNSAQSGCWQKAEGRIPHHLFMAINSFVSLKGNSINPFHCVTFWIINMMGKYS